MHRLALMGDTGLGAAGNNPLTARNMTVSGERAGEWMVAGRVGGGARVVSMGISNLPVSPSQRCGMRPRANQLQAR